MEVAERIERTLTETFEASRGASCPPRLDEAVRYAIFPGGARVRPTICLAVADACNEDCPEISEAAAASIELLHCASLVHDDLPCFDDSPLRRGRPSVHQAFGERLAVLAGDALIVLAFNALTRAAVRAPERLPVLIEIIAASVGMPRGIVAGQAWECEAAVDLDDYQQLKTGALFAAATAAGAAAAGEDPLPWRALGERIGSAYQVVDDILDVAGDSEQLGKPVGQDEARGHPSSVRELGLDGARRQFQVVMAGVFDKIPPCPGADRLKARIVEESSKFLPATLAEHAA
ncbi:MAG: geranylgeranyl pyrophosphate synthase [Gammaproteobacteria bacterium]|jgi:geranylgeranyl diphosphate synthase type II|nr:geranylgeranyl pyrophosphate synthase [Gammaproteobacteria bacterium]